MKQVKTYHYLFTLSLNTLIGYLRVQRLQVVCDRLGLGIQGWDDRLLDNNWRCPQMTMNCWKQWLQAIVLEEVEQLSL